MKKVKKGIFWICDSISLHKIAKDSKYNFVELTYEIDINAQNIFILFDILKFFANCFMCI